MVLSLLTSLFLFIGATFALLAAIGLVRLPDVFMRMQASAKASTLGLACLLIGAGLQLPDVSSVIRLATIQAFIMFTAPLSAHVVARASFRRRIPLWEHTTINEREDLGAEASNPETPSTTSSETTPEADAEHERELAAKATLELATDAEAATELATDTEAEREPQS